MNRRGFLGALSGLLAFFGSKRVAQAELPPVAPEPMKDFPPCVTQGSVTQKRGIWKNQGGRRVYTDLFEMFDAITYHTKKTGSCIWSADDPLGNPPMICFCAEGPAEDPYRGTVDIRVWGITLPNVRISLHMLETGNLRAQQVAKLVRTYLQTAAGRAALAASFPGQRKVT